MTVEASKSLTNEHPADPVEIGKTNVTAKEQTVEKKGIEVKSDVWSYQFQQDLQDVHWSSF